MAGDDENRPTAAFPTSLTSFVGREREIAGLRERLQQPGVRLVTVTGTGGVGKTSLAVHVAAEMAAAFANGTAFVSLVPVHDPALVATTILNTLGQQVHGAASPTTALIQHLATRQMLLVLDNFEQVLDAAPLVAQLLAACPMLAMLVTSRAPLRIAGEWEYPLVPLALPSDDDAANVEQIAATAAVALFVERARAVRPGFRLTTDNAAIVAEICRRLDGLPLAIELAAARIRHVPPATMLDRLSHRLAFLSHGARDAPARHQTLRDTIAWSYGLLSPEEQQIFRAGSIFRGGWTLDAIEHVVGEHLATSVVDGMDQLAEHSLVRVLEQPNGDLRYDMLETIREFGLEQLDTSAERRALSQRYERYFAALAQQAGPELQGPDQRRWFTILRREHDNVRAALAGLLERGAGTIALEVAVAIATFWRSQGYSIEGRLWLERALAAADDAPAALRAEACFDIGIVARSQGDSAEAERVMTIAVSLYREASDQAGLTNSISGLAWNAIYLGQYERANDLLEYAVNAARSSGDERLIADMLADQSVGWATIGEYGMAKAAAEESTLLWRAIGDRRSLSQALGYLGFIWLWEGDVDRAEQVGRECLAIAEDIEDGLVSFANELLATIALERGDFERAGKLFRFSLRPSQTQQDFMTMAECLEGLAGVAGGYGNVARGAVLLGAAEAVREHYGSPVPPPRQDRYQRTLTVIQSGQEPAAFDLAWSQGRLMSPDQAVEYGLQPEPPTVAESRPEADTILSKREREVLRLLVEGKTNQEIATALFISPHTVTNHVTSILTKLNLESRTAAATYALRHGLV